MAFPAFQRKTIAKQYAKLMGEHDLRSHVFAGQRRYGEDPCSSHLTSCWWCLSCRVLPAQHFSVCCVLLSSCCCSWHQHPRSVFRKPARAKFGADSDVFQAESEGGSTVHRMSWPSHRARHAQPCVPSSFKTVTRTVPTMTPNMCEQPHTTY